MDVLLPAKIKPFLPLLTYYKTEPTVLTSTQGRSTKRMTLIYRTNIIEK